MWFPQLAFVAILFNLFAYPNSLRRPPENRHLESFIFLLTACENCNIMDIVKSMSAGILSSDTRLQGNEDAQLRTMLTLIFKRSGKSRAQIADDLSIRTGRKISIRQLDNWTSTARQDTRRFPAALIEPLCELLADDSLQRYVMGKRLRQLVRLGEIQIERETIRAELLKNGGRRRGKNKKR
jgi:hypothetical protein